MATVPTHSIAHPATRQGNLHQLKPNSQWVSHYLGQSLFKALFCAISPLLFATLSTTSHASTGVTDAALCMQLSARTGRVRVKPVAKPPYQRLFKEPAFGTQVMRISNSSVGTVNKPGGQAAQAWNHDESRLMLHHYDANGEHSVRLHDGHNYDLIGTLKLPPLANENVYWSQQDPNILFYMPNTDADAGKLTQLNIATGERATLANFAPYCKKRGLSAVGGSLKASAINDDLFGFSCAIKNNQSLAAVYKLSSNTISTLRTGSGTKWPANSIPAPMPAGGTLLMAGKLLNSNLKATANRLDIASSNAPAAIGLSSTGANTYFQSAAKRSPRGCSGDIWNGVGTIVKHEADTGNCSALVTQTKGYPATPEGAELAANAYQNPRWLAMSNIGYENIGWFTENRVAPLLFSEIILVDTEQDEPKPCRLTHMRNYGEQASNASYPLSLAKANVSLSPTATRVLYSSDWYDSGSIDTYVVILPGYTRLNIAGEWTDSDNSGIKTLFTQAADQISFMRMMKHPKSDKDITLLGKGYIISEQINIDYQYEEGGGVVVKGMCKGSQATDKSTIKLNCLNDVYKTKLTFDLKRP